jgi:pseudaminic acid synthase
MPHQSDNNVFIIAELSANHNGSKKVALDSVRAAKAAGADAVKLQTYTADTMTLDVKNDYFKIDHGTHWDGQNLHELYQKAYLPWEWHQEIFDLAKNEGLVCFSTPFDLSSVDFLEKLDNPIYKVASPEITDIPLISYIASKQKPIIISTGIATLEDIDLAVAACIKENNSDLTILKCTSAYPTEPEDANLLTIPDIKKRYNVKVGLSDHTMGIEAPVVAVALGATIIEKHFILDKGLGGPDAHFSLDKEEFKQMVDAVRTAELMLGRVEYELYGQKKKSRDFSRSLFIAEDVQKGQLLSPENIRSIRPGYGLHPKHYYDILGKSAAKDLKKGTPLSWDDIN